MNTLEYEAHILEYKAHTLLMFLLAHDEADAKLLGLDLSPVLNAANRDVRGTLSVEDQKVTLTLTNGLTFQSRDRYDYYTLQIPQVQNEPGVFYRCDTRYPASGEVDSFFITQYPTFFGERGRIVIDLWMNDKIVGVFKTNSSNFGACGSGTWRAAN